MSFGPFYFIKKIFFIFIAFILPRIFLEKLFGNILDICFLCENQRFRFGKLEGLIFLENSYIHYNDIHLYIFTH
jgi:hypothetical protein